MSDTQDFSKEIRTILAYKREADTSRRDRMTKNATNFDFYHLKQDYAHKKTGQSQEFLPKQSMAVEQITAFVHQGLIDLGEWFSIDPKAGNRAPILTRDQARTLLADQLDKAAFFTFIQDALKSGLLGSLMIAKVHGEMKESPVYFTEKTPSGEIALKRRKNLVWELKIDLLRQKDYFPDPTGEGLYEIQDIEMDLWKLKELAAEHPDIYDTDAINSLGGYIDDEERRWRERETDQAPSESNYRKRVTISEFWGTIVDESGEVLHKNVVCAVAQNAFMIRKPRANPFWHGKSPFVVSSLVRVPHSVWHKALMDSPTQLNQAVNELFNLILDSGINAVFGVRQVHEDWIDNADEMSNGIFPGFVAKVNSSCPPGAKAIETVSSGSINPSEGLQVLNLANAELQAASLSNDLRQGVLPSRAVKATEVVEASQSITSVFTGIAKAIESSFMEVLLDRAWLTTMQYSGDMDKDEIAALLGESESEHFLKLSPQERFAKTINGHRFKAFGITQTINKIKDYKKYTTFLQTIAQSPVLMEESNKRYDVAKLIVEIVKSLDINEDKIKLDESDALMEKVAGAQDKQEGDAGAAVQGAPQGLSQVPQVAAMPQESLSAIPQTHFSGRAFNGG